MQNNYQHFSLALDENNILWLSIDRKDSSANSLNKEVLSEFNTILDTISAESIKGLIIRSAKKTGFIVGADIEQFKLLTSQEQAVALIKEGQAIFDKLEKLPFPTLALIEGFCLGGGYELALACRYRIAEDSPSVKIGLPEVKLGIHPGWGGTVRLPKLVGALKAFDAILKGRFYSAKEAARLGMIDKAIPKRHLETAARDFILSEPHKHQANFIDSISNTTAARFVLSKVFKLQLSKMIKKEHYPAPFKVIDNWLKEGISESAYNTEANSIGELLVSDTSRNLIRVFNLNEKLKNQTRNTKFIGKAVHVVGSGIMGGDIAAWCALRGFKVTLQDREASIIGPAVARAYKLFKKKLKEPRLIQEAMDRLLPDPNGDGIASADVIIEAIYENLDAKQQLFKMLEQKAKPTAILATNTSSIPLDEISQVLTHPKRLVGIHFFNPVASLPLVEVVQSQTSDQEVVNQAMAFVRRIDKLPMPVKSSPGFLVNRVLMPYLMEAIYLYNDGVPLAAIDKAAIDFGMPMGPIELADKVGLDVCLAVGNYLTQFFGGKMPELLTAKVNAGELGAKSGRGFYEYKNGKVIKPPVDKAYHAPNDITSRLILRMCLEADACLKEGIVADADLVDAGMIFGAGFAPFRGGPLHYLEQEGHERFQAKLKGLQSLYGERFKLKV